jgi:hypothetical protein
MIAVVRPLPTHPPALRPCQVAFATRLCQDNHLSGLPAEAIKSKSALSTFINGPCPTRGGREGSEAIQGGREGASERGERGREGGREGGGGVIRPPDARPAHLT